MSGKYVPPSRREGYVAKPDARPPWIKDRVQRGPKPNSGHFFEELEAIFSTEQQGTYNHYINREPIIAPLEFDPTRTPYNTPLPLSTPFHPLGHLICYIMIFPRAHPLWESGGELWHHTGSGTLAEDWKGEKKNFGRPIPVFTSSIRDARGTKAGVQFLGWWTINALRMVEPQSDELIDLLETKERMKGYSNNGRTPDKWVESLTTPWVKTRLTLVDESHPKYTQMVDPLTLGQGEGGLLVLQVGGMEEEAKTLEAHQKGELPPFVDDAKEGNI